MKNNRILPIISSIYDKNIKVSLKQCFFYMEILKIEHTKGKIDTLLYINLSHKLFKCMLELTKDVK